MIALSALLVAVAFVTLIIGVFQSGLSMIWVSIAASVAAAVTLAIGVVRSRPKTVAVGGPPEPLGSWTGSATPVLDEPDTARGWEPEPTVESSVATQAGAVGDEAITSVLDLSPEAELELPPIMRAPARPRSIRAPAKKPAAKKVAAKAPAKRAAKAPAKAGSKTAVRAAPKSALKSAGGAAKKSAKKASPAKKTAAKSTAAKTARKAPARKTASSDAGNA